MVSIIVSVLTALNQAGFRAKRGTLNDKAIAPNSPVIVVYPEKSAPDERTVAVEVFGSHAVNCEDKAYEAVTVLSGLRASCTVEKCQYSGKTGLFSVKVLASWPAPLAQKVYLDDTLMSNLTDFRAESASAVYKTEDGTYVQPDWIWTLTLEELLATGKTPEADWSGSHTVKVVTDGGTELYTGCRWIQVQREGDSRGTLQTTKLKSWYRTVL